MNKQIKKSLALVLCLVMMVASVPLGGVDFGGAFEVAAASEVDSGSCGDSVTWVLDSDYVLTISGTGEMYDYDCDAPWCDLYSDFITSVVIEYGVTSIGDYAFFGCSNFTSVTIPESVTSIGKFAFYFCTNLTSVTIPSGITSINDYTFYNCTNLTSITLPNSLTSVGTSAFEFCENLTTVKFKGTQYQWNDIGFGANNDSIIEASISYVEFFFGEYGDNITWTLEDGLLTISGTGDMEYYSDIAMPWDSYRSSITTVVISSGITSIAEYAFMDCSNLEIITISNSVTSIGESAFENCTSLTTVYYNGTLEQWESIEFGSSNSAIQDTNVICDTAKSGECGENLTWEIDDDGVLTISGTGAMYDYSRLEETAPWYTFKNAITAVVIESGVTSIGDYAFHYCQNLASVTIPDSVDRIGSYAFYYCQNLASVTIPDSVYSIGSSAFYYCQNLASVTIPDSVDSIGFHAFCGCTNLTSVTMSKTDVSDYVFSSCDNLEIVYFHGTEADWETMIIGDNANLTNAEIIFSDHFFGEWEITTPTSCTDDGEQTRYCECCGETETEVIEALGHTFGDWEITTPASCTEDGEETRYCTECAAYETEVIAAFSHNWKEYITTEATCTSKGEAEYICIYCDSSFTAALPATGHTFVDGTCVDCNITLQDICTCACHSSGFDKFWFDFLTFFRQIFGMTEYKYCDCGNSHW